MKTDFPPIERDYCVPDRKLSKRILAKSVEYQYDPVASRLWWDHCINQGLCGVVAQDQRCKLLTKNVVKESADLGFPIIKIRDQGGETNYLFEFASIKQAALFKLFMT